MAEIRPKSPCAALLPLKIGKVCLTEVQFESITSVAPFKGRHAEVSEALDSLVGAAFPEPNRTTGKAHARAVWSGRGQCLVLGSALERVEGAATTDQTDAWACVALDGPGAADVLARLVPIDMRPETFEVGHAARTLVGHMSAIVMRTGAERYGLMVFRSVARTLVHELKSAMETAAARA